MSMKGIVTFYMNVEHCKNPQEEKDYINLMVSTNSSIMQRMEESQYGAMVVPVRKESSRVEKIDFDSPFPRYLLPHVDIVEHDQIMGEIRERSVKNAEKESE